MRWPRWWREGEVELRDGVGRRRDRIYRRIWYRRELRRHRGYRAVLVVCRRHRDSHTVGRFEKVRGGRVALFTFGQMTNMRLFRTLGVTFCSDGKVVRVYNRLVWFSARPLLLQTWMARAAFNSRRGCCRHFNTPATLDLVSWATVE